MTASTEMSPYQRLGGHAGIASVVKDLYGRMVHDSAVWYHWKGLTADSLATEIQWFTDLVCSVAGNQDEFLSQDRATTGMSLGIRNVEWRYFVSSAAEILEQSGLPDTETDELFSILARAKALIANDDQSRSNVAVFAVFPHQLTQREKEVLRLLAMGMNNPQIAGELVISINTVTRHISNIFAKTSTNNRVQAAVYAARRHLV